MHSLLSNTFLSWWELFLLKGTSRFEILSKKVSTTMCKNYTRCVVSLKDHQQNKVFLGVAEGENEYQAQVRSVAEAYEKSCFYAYKNKSNLNYPYGFGCAISSNVALKRAWGEYYERKLLCFKRFVQRMEVNKFTIKELPVNRSKIYIAFYKDSEGVIGSGYSYDYEEAKDSAIRSYIRKKDYPNLKQSNFEIIPHQKPKVVCLTPKKQAWLECYYVGF